MDRGRAGGYLTDNNLAEIQAVKKRHDLHVKRLEKIQSRRPCGSTSIPMKGPPLVPVEVKSQRLASVRQAQSYVMEQENKSLLKRLGEILTSKPRQHGRSYEQLHHQRKPITEDGRHQLKKAQEEKQNKRFFDSIKNTKSYYQRKDWEADYKKQLDHQRFMRQVKYRRPPNFVDKFSAEPQQHEESSSSIVTAEDAIHSSASSLTGNSSYANGSSQVSRVRRYRQERSLSQMSLQMDSSTSSLTSTHSNQSNSVNIHRRTAPQNRQRVRNTMSVMSRTGDSVVCNASTDEVEEDIQHKGLGIAEHSYRSHRRNSTSARSTSPSKRGGSSRSPRRTIGSSSSSRGGTAIHGNGIIDIEDTYDEYDSDDDFEGSDGEMRSSMCASFSSDNSNRIGSSNSTRSFRVQVLEGADLFPLDGFSQDDPKELYDTKHTVAMLDRRVVLHRVSIPMNGSMKGQRANRLAMALSASTESTTTDVDAHLECYIGNLNLFIVQVRCLIDKERVVSETTMNLDDLATHCPTLTPEVLTAPIDPLILCSTIRAFAFKCLETVELRFNGFETQVCLNLDSIQSDLPQMIVPFDDPIAAVSRLADPNAISKSQNSEQKFLFSRGVRMEVQIAASTVDMYNKIREPLKVRRKMYVYATSRVFIKGDGHIVVESVPVNDIFQHQQDSKKHQQLILPAGTKIHHVAPLPSVVQLDPELVASFADNYVRNLMCEVNPTTRNVFLIPISSV